jgi:hypothetical protein
MGGLIRAFTADWAAATRISWRCGLAAMQQVRRQELVAEELVADVPELARDERVRVVPRHYLRLAGCAEELAPQPRRLRFAHGRTDSRLKRGSREAALVSVLAIDPRTRGIPVSAQPVSTQGRNGASASSTSVRAAVSRVVRRHIAAAMRKQAACTAM